MAQATKRTSVLLGTLAVVFIAIIIILCIVPKGGSPPDSSQEEQKSKPILDVIDEDTTTTTTTTTTTEPTTRPTPAPTTDRPTTHPSTTITTTTTKPTTAPTTPEPTTAQVIPESTTAPTTPESMTVSTTPESTTVSTTPESMTVSTTPESMTVSTTPESMTVSTTPESMTVSTTPESMTVSTTPESMTVSTTPESTIAQGTPELTTSPTTPELTTVPIFSDDVTDASTSTSTTAATVDSSTASVISESPTDATSREPDSVSPTSDATTVLTTDESTTDVTASDAAGVSPTSEPTTVLVTDESTTVDSTSEPASVSPTSDATTASSTTEFPTTFTTTQYSTELLTATETTSQDASTISSTSASPPLCPVSASAAVATCDTPACKTVAANMLAMMDHSQGVNPCQDFYQYACGGLEQNPFLDAANPRVLAGKIIKEKLDTLDHSSTPEGKMKTFYDSCISAVDQTATEDWIQPVKDLFGEYRFGQQPPTSELTDVLAYMMEHDFAPFFDVNLDVFRNDSEQFVVTLQPVVPISFGENAAFSEDLARKVCLEEHERNLKKTDDYDVEVEYKIFTECVLTGRGLEARLGRMEEAVQRLGLLDGLGNTSTSRSQLLQETKNIARDLLQDLAKELPSIPQLKKDLVNKNYTQKSIDDLLSTVIDWNLLVSRLITSTGDVTEVQVYMEDKITGAVNVLQKYHDQNPVALNNVLLMLWSERLYTDFVKPVGSNVGEQEYCLHVAITLMQDTASFLYLDALSYDEVKARQDQINRIAKSVQYAGEKALGNLTEQQPVEKLRDVLSHIITGDLKDGKDRDRWHRAANESIEMLNITATDFLNNCLQLLKNRRTLLYSMYTDDTNSMWSKFMRPYDPAGVHVYALSRIMIPYAAQKYSSVFENVPEYLSYAGIGHMISNLVVHGYDTTGLYYQDGRYKLMDGFSHFNTSLQGLKGKLVARQGLIANLTMDTLSLNELLADSGATKLAWEAYLLRNETMPTAAPSVSTFIGRDAFRRRRRRSAPNTVPQELPLPWLSLTPIQLYFLHWSQHHCSANGGMSMLELMESEQPPALLRVNLVLQNNQLFNQAFQCTPEVETPFILG